MSNNLQNPPEAEHVDNAAQETANAIQNDNAGESNSRFTITNYLWCLLGLFTWLLVIANLAGQSNLRTGAVAIASVPTKA